MSWKWLDAWGRVFCFKEKKTGHRRVVDFFFFLSLSFCLSRNSIAYLLCIFRTGFLMWSVHFSPHINAIFDAGPPGSQSTHPFFAKTLLLVIVAGLVGNDSLAPQPLAPMLESTSKIHLQ